MPKAKSPQNRGLPKRWRKIHGAYFYRVPPGQESQWDGKKQFRLGKTMPEAFAVFAERVEQTDNIRTIGDLLDRYLRDVVPTKSPTTRESNLFAVPKLRAVFGHMPLNRIVPADIYRYVDLRKKTIKKDGKEIRVKALTSAHRELEVLSHAYTKAVEWGFLNRHPFLREVRLQGDNALKPRTRYVEDWEVLESLSIASKRKRGSVLSVQAYIRLKLLTGLARGDLLRLTEFQLREDGIHVQRHKTAEKTGKRTIYQWTDELRQAVEDAKASRAGNSTFLFCDRYGNGYINEETDKCPGWKSIWSRFMSRVLKETKVQERFTEHDLRAKAGSDAESLEHAQALLQHASPTTTKRIYRRGPEKVMPLKGTK